MNSALGDRVRALRKTRGLSQQALAKAAKISQPSLSDIETGQTSFQDLKAPTLLALAEALEVDPRHLAGRRSVDPLATQLLWLYDRLSPDSRDTLLGNAQRLYTQEHPEASAANPFGSTQTATQPPASAKRHL